MPRNRKSLGAPDAMPPKQQRFVDEYLIDGNASAAYRRAGYTSRNPDVNGVRLLGNARVAAAIERGRARLAERTQWTQERVIRQLEPIAESDIRDVATWNNRRVEFVPSAELPDRVARAISEISAETVEISAPGKRTKRTIKMRVKFWDKQTATDQLARHFGYYKPTRIAPTTPDGAALVPLSDDERARRVVALIERGKVRKVEADRGGSGAKKRPSRADAGA